MAVDGPVEGWGAGGEPRDEFPSVTPGGGPVPSSWEGGPVGGWGVGWGALPCVRGRCGPQADWVPWRGSCRRPRLAL